MKTAKAITAALLTVAILSGCGSQPQKSSNAGSSGASSASGAASSSTGSVYPLQGGKKLTYWVGVTAPNNATSNDDIPLWQELQKRTGIDIEFSTFVSGQEKEAFNLMLASGEYPDIIESKQIETGTLFSKGIIMDLTDIIPKYSPNYYKYLQEHPDVMKQVKSDDSKLMLYPLIREDPRQMTTTGPIIRKDWLDKLNIQEPETIAEWEAMLTAFKEKLNCPIPLGTRASTTTTNFIASAFNIYLGFYQEDGNVKYGYLEPAFKDYLTTMSSWYKKGLYDKNFASASKETQDANFLSGKQGSTFGAAGGQLGTWMSAAKSNGDTTFNLVGAKLPVSKKGDTPAYYDITQFQYSNGNPWAMISTKCKDVEAAARLLDYGYTEEGKKLLNFGIEGKSYNVVNGEIVPLSEQEIKDKFNMTQSDFRKMYARSSDSGPFVLDPHFMKYTQTPTQLDALAKWGQNDNLKHKMPPLTLSPEESTEFSSIMADIKTYNDEMIVKFIMGVEPLSNIEKYQATVKSMGIDKAIKIQQGALDRYNKR
ncbi:MAG TPA: ABC transporter substrate-binding protein [Ruminococcaceae bacterium]|nr:ABC transporter substrate-binding protein [Oscillospiraceae bacterium]